MNVRTTAQALIVRSLPEIRPDTDTGARLIHGDAARAYGRSFDDGWLYLTTPAGAGWSSAAYLEETPALPSDAWVERPHGLVSLRETFGEPANPRCSAGMVQLPELVRFWDGAYRQRFACHELVAPIFTSFFGQLYRRGLWPLLHSFDGCYNPRMKAGTTTKQSTHAWGIAIDVNAATNGLGRVPQLDRRIVAIGRDHQLVWGGDWSRPDGMHFQYATGY